MAKPRRLNPQKTSSGPLQAGRSTRLDGRESAKPGSGAALTPRQAEVFAFIRQNVDERGFPPTVAEIAQFFGMRSQNAAAQHLRLILQKGFIQIEPGLSRGIRIVRRETSGGSSRSRRDASLRTLPVVGRVAAGSPILAEENYENTLALDPAAFRPRADYLLRVSGDSMIGAGIEDGDLVAVHRTTDVANGKIAVVRLGGDTSGEVTVKRIRRRGVTLTLIPENPALRPVELSLKDEPACIEGLVVGLVRHYL